MRLATTIMLALTLMAAGRDTYERRGSAVMRHVQREEIDALRGYARSVFVAGIAGNKTDAELAAARAVYEHSLTTIENWERQWARADELRTLAFNAASRSTK